ncbi:hypothetical protein COT29_04450, partial [Candidatus Micrarchaeota archaeon CG08_land_8_20_14_0_20_59_11]
MNIVEKPRLELRKSLLGSILARKMRGWYVPAHTSDGLSELTALGWQSLTASGAMRVRSMGAENDNGPDNKQAVRNLSTNPSMETNLGGWTEWKTATGTTERSSERAYKGSYSLKVVMTDSTDADQIVIRYSDIPIEAGKT